MFLLNISVFSFSDLSQSLTINIVSSTKNLQKSYSNTSEFIDLDMMLEQFQLHCTEFHSFVPEIFVNMCEETGFIPDSACCQYSFLFMKEIEDAIKEINDILNLHVNEDFSFLEG